MPLYKNFIADPEGFSNIRPTISELTVASVILVSIIWISSSINILYAMSDHGNQTIAIMSNNNIIGKAAQPLTNDSSALNTPSVLHLSPVLNNTNSNNNAMFASSTPNGNNADSNTTTSNSGTHHIHHGINFSRSSGNHHNNKNNSHDLAQKITTSIEKKFNVGDIPFP